MTIKITDPRYVNFSETYVGDVFRYGETIGMRIATADSLEVSNERYNTANLSNGILTRLDDSDKVVLVNAELRIREGAG